MLWRRSASGLARVRRGASAPALVEQHDAVPLGVEEAAVPGGGSRARTAVEEHDRLAVGIAALLPVDAVAVADDELAGLVRLDRRIEDVVEVLVHRLSPGDREGVAGADAFAVAGLEPALALLARAVRPALGVDGSAGLLLDVVVADGLRRVDRIQRPAAASAARGRGRRSHPSARSCRRPTPRRSSPPAARCARRCCRDRCRRSGAAP